MFNLFKSKPILKDLIPDGHIDIHSHLLPGIDDGARTVEDSCDLREHFRLASLRLSLHHIIQHVWDNTPEKIVSTKNTTILELQKKQFKDSFPSSCGVLNRRSVCAAFNPIY
jgi:hypothetical protein